MVDGLRVRVGVRVGPRLGLRLGLGMGYIVAFERIRADYDGLRHN